MSTNVDADVICPKHGPYVSVRRVRWPVEDWEVVPKEYCDANSGATYTYILPLRKDDILFQISIDEAASGTAGIISTGSQYISGDKTYEGEIYMLDTSPSTANTVITRAYLETILTNVVFETPMSASGTNPMYVSIASAAATSPGVISGLAQTLGGPLTLTGGLSVIGNMTVGGSASFLGTVTAVTNDITLADTQVATGALVREATLGCGFDACNGWISGLKITQTGLNKYIVGAGAYRFNDYYSTDPARVGFPICNAVVSHAAFAEKTIDASWPATLVTVGVYIKNEVDGGNIGKLYELAGISATSQLYGDYIQLGALVIIGGMIISVANVKLPFADRTGISVAEMAALICPINLGPNYIEKHDDPSVNLALKMAGGGYLWEYGANCNNDIFNRHTVIMTAWDSSVPYTPLWRVWQNDSLELVAATDPGAYIDTGYYNPGCVGTELSVAVSGKWYNSPILFNPAAQIFIQQYPTNEYATEEEALKSPHAFVRLYGSGTARYLICLGVITYEGLVSDLSAATIAGGEYFNYQAAGGSGGGAVGGGGGGVSNVEERYTAWVFAAPCTTLGAMGSISNPFPGYSGAVSAAYGVATESRPAMVHLSAGYHETPGPAELKPFVSVAGFTMGSTRFMAAGKFVPGSEFATVDNARCSVRNMRIVIGSGYATTSGVDLDMHTVAGTNMHSLFDIYDTEVEGNFRYTGRQYGTDGTSGDECRFTCCVLHSPSTIDGGDVIMNNVFFSTDQLGSDELTLQATNCVGNITIIASLLRDICLKCESTFDLNVTISSTFMQDGSSIKIQQSGTNTVTLNIDRGSVPFPATTRMVYDRTNTRIIVNVYDEDEAQENAVFVSAVGNDVRDGNVLNNSVLTLPRAMLIASSVAGVIDPCVINCMDAEVFPSGGTEDITFGTFVSLFAPAATMRGTMNLVGSNNVSFARVFGNIHVDNDFGGVIPTENIILNIGEFYSAKLTVVGTQPALYANIAMMNAGAPSTELITVSESNYVYLSGNVATGLITATGAGAFIDISGIHNYNACTFSAVNGGVIRYGPNFGTAADVSGILKGSGIAGVLVAASAGTDFLVGTQALTLTQDISASGALTGTINATINAGVVTFAKLASLASMSVIGNSSGALAVPSAVSISSGYGATTLAYRDGSGNLYANHLTQAYSKVSSLATPLTAASPTMFNYSGAGETCVLPLLATVSTGFSFNFWNSGSTALVVSKQGGDPAFSVTVSAGSYAHITSLGTTLGWDCMPIYVAGGAGNIPIASIQTAPAWSVLARQTSTSGAAEWYTSGAAVVASGLVVRDASGNALANHFSSGYKGITLTSNTVAITAATEGKLRILSGSGALKMPVVSGLATGLEYDVYNLGSGTVTVFDETGTSGGLAVLTQGMYTTFIVDSAGGWDVLPLFPTMNFYGIATGSGALNVTLTAAANQTPMSALATIVGPALLGNLSTSAANIGTIATYSIGSASSVAIRDASGNAAFGHAVETYVTFTANQTLTSSTAAYIVWSGSPTACTLPSTTGLSAGFKYTMYNGGSASIIFNNSVTSTPIATLLASATADVIFTGAANTWQFVPFANPAGIPSYSIDLTDLVQITGPVVLGNPGASLADVSLITCGAAATASTIVMRDTSINAAFGHAVESYATFSSNQTLTQTNAAYIVWSGTPTLCTLASTANYLPGFKYTMYNGGSNSIAITNSTGGAVGTLLASATADVVFTGTANTWKFVPFGSLAGITVNSITPNYLAQITGPVVLGNLSTSAADIGTISIYNVGSASSVALRDASGNAGFGHAVEAYVTFTANQTLTSSSAAYIVWSGTPTACTLASTANLLAGFKYTMYNGGSNPIVINNSAGSPIGTLTASTTADVIFTGAVNTWQFVPFANPAGIPGSFSLIPQITGPVVIGNLTTSAATATTIPTWATATISSIVIRDASANAAFNHAVEAYATYSSNQTLTQTNAAYIVWSGSPSLCSLASTAGYLPGFKYTMYNGGSAAIVLSSILTASFATIPASTGADVIFTGTTNVWTCIPFAGSSSIGTNSVPLSAMTQITGPVLLGNLVASPANVTTIAVYSTANATSVALRDGSANFAANNIAMNIGQYTATTLALAVSHPYYVEYTGASVGAWTLPPCTTLAYSGYTIRVNNRSPTYNLALANSGSDVGGAATVGPGQFFEFVCLSTSGTWSSYATPNGLFQTAATFTVAVGSRTIMINGACTTTGVASVALIDYDASAIGSANALSVEYNVVCVAATGSSGQFVGSFRAYCATGASPSLTVTTPFTSAFTSLDAGVATCTLTAVGSTTPGHLTFLVTGVAATVIKWTGEATITQRAL